MSKQYQMYIGGKWEDSFSGETIPSINPTTEEILWEIPRGNSQDVEKAVTAAHSCFHSNEWQILSYKDRAEILHEIANLIIENSTHLAQIESKENGKPIKESSLIDIPEAAETFRSFAAQTLQLKGETYPTDGSTLSYTFYEPMGVVALIIPWNYPLLMAAWKIAPAIAAGNTVVIKPSELTSATLLELAKLLEMTSLPKGAINIVTGTGEEVGAPLVSHPLISKVSFTGSTKTGKKIIAQSANSIIPTTMELGGKSATIVTKDANINSVIGGLLTTIFMNQGQMCVAGSRLLIESEIYTTVIKKLKEKLSLFTIGDSSKPTTDMGPLISKEHKEKVEAMVERAITEGAEVLFGKEDIAIPEVGFFTAPTLLSKVTSNMAIWQEEVFGPVLIVTPFNTLDEAIELANNSDYGLACSLWSKNHYTIQRVTREVKVGTIWVNTYGSFSNEVPFGGVKKSGFGKDLGLDSLLSYCHKKSVTMDISPDETPLVSRWYR